MGYHYFWKHPSWLRAIFWWFECSGSDKKLFLKVFDGTIWGSFPQYPTLTRCRDVVSNKSEAYPASTPQPKVATKRDNMVVDLFKVFQKEILKEKHLHNIQVPSQIRNPLRSTCPQKSDWRQWEPPTTWNYEQNFHPKRSQNLANTDFCSPIVTWLLSGPRVCRPIVALWVAHWRHEGILDRHPEIVEMYQNWTRIHLIWRLKNFVGKVVQKCIGSVLVWEVNQDHGGWDISHLAIHKNLSYDFKVLQCNRTNPSNLLSQISVLLQQAS